MYNPSPRYEFRLFGQCFGTEEKQLRTLADIDSITESCETYFLGRAPKPGRNVKYRGGSLELKRLIERQAGLERWQPAGQWTLPAATDTALDLLLPGDGDTWKPALSAQLGLDELLVFAARPDVPLLRAEVFKRRFHFALSPCRAEVDQLLVNGAAIQSLAIEAEDPDAVHELQKALRIEGRENVSYPLALSRIMGMGPPSPGGDHG